MEAHWKHGQTNEEYHADKTAIGSSSLRQMLKSPATYWHYLNATEKEQTASMELGSLVHMAILEPELFHRSCVRMPDFGDQRTKINKEKKEEFMNHLSNLSIPVKHEDYETVLGIVASVGRHEGARHILKQGQAEVSGYYEDPTTGLLCKIRPDFLNLELMALVDVKTTSSSCEAEAFSRTIWKYRYDVQIAHYTQGVKQITGNDVVYPCFLVVETKPPYEVSVFIADEEMIKKGLQDYRNCLDKIKVCRDTNTWPQYQTQIEPIALPQWAVREII
jgi:hypothetical protein